MALKMHTAETVVRDTFRPLTNALGLTPDEAPHYRRAFADDAPDADVQEKRYPCIEITSGYWGPGQGQNSLMLSAVVEVRIITLASADPKRALLARLVDAVMPTCQQKYTGWDFTQIDTDGGVSCSVMLAPSAPPELDDQYQTVSFLLTFLAQVSAT